MANMHPINYDDLNDDLEFTINLWVKPLRFGATDFLIYFDNLIRVYIIVNTGQIRLDLVAGRTWTGAEGAKYLVLRYWQRLAMVKSATGFKLIKDQMELFNFP